MYRLITYFLVLITALGLAACAANPAAGIPKAQIFDAPAPSTFEKKAGAETLKITPENSKIEFTGSKVTGSESGRFEDFNGTIELSDNSPEKSRVQVEINTASVVTNAKGLDSHLKTADFFDVEKFPKATFISSAVKKLENGATGMYELNGSFELHGVAKSISFPANIKIDEKSAVVTSEFSINRRDFGIMYAGRTNDLIRDEVVIKLTINTSRSRQ